MTTEHYINTWKSFGINTVEDYHSRLRDLWDNEEFNKSFKKIDYKSFWKAADIHFGTDPVCNQVKGKEFMDPSKMGLDTKRIKDSNKVNWFLAHMMGASGYLDLYFRNYNIRYGDSIPNFGEIGSGYGCIKEYLSTKAVNYTGFDLIPRFDNVVEVMGDDGCLSDEQVDEYRNHFNLMYSFNVFQHLELHQISKYFDQMYEMLNKNEYSSLIIGICLNSKSYHYGQMIDLPTDDEFRDIIRGKFRPLMCNMSYQQSHMGLHAFYLDPIR